MRVIKGTLFFGIFLCASSALAAQQRGALPVVPVPVAPPPVQDPVDQARKAAADAETAAAKAAADAKVAAQHAADLKDAAAAADIKVDCAVLQKAENEDAKRKGVAAKTVKEQECEPRLRWELITAGATDIRGQGSSTVSNFATGTDANFLFRLNYLADKAGETGRKTVHLVFETGITNPARAVTAKVDPSSSDAVQILGSTSTPTPTTGPTATSLSHERAFTVGATFDVNRVWKDNGSATFAEFGFVAKPHFDAYFDDQKVFEKDGLTYIRLSDPKVASSGFVRGEAGLRFRLGYDVPNKPNGADLLLVEGLVQHAGALKGLTPTLGSNATNRWVFRFVASPEIPGAVGTKGSKLVIGLEAANDLKNHGPKDIRLIYGINVDIPKLFD